VDARYWTKRNAFGFKGKFSDLRFQNIMTKHIKSRKIHNQNDQTKTREKKYIEKTKREKK